MSRELKASGKIDFRKLLHKLSPYTIKKGLRYLKHYGPKEFMIRLHERFEPEEIPYDLWYAAYCPKDEELEKQRKKIFRYAPLISIAVPAYRTPEAFVRDMIQSLRAQTYSNWEVCIANGSPDDENLARVLKEYQDLDARVHVKILKDNLGIAGNTNAAMDMAKGEYVALLDHDDVLAPNALYEIISCLQGDSPADVIYTDEDKVTMDLSEHFQPHFKPDFNIDLLRSNNYICHFFVVSKKIYDQIGGFRKEYDGAQDYDFIFRCIEKAAHVAHVPEILYHWRTHKESTADNPASKLYAYEAGKRAIESHLKRSGETGTVSMLPDYGFYRVTYPVVENPLVSILIPNKDSKDLLKRCVESILEKTSYTNYEILIIENNSTGREIFDYYKELGKNERIRLLRYEASGFNYSAINNFAARKARGEYLVLLNNDIRITQEDWLSELVSQCMRKDVGAAGVKLVYPDRTIQHAGIVVGMGGIAGAMFVGMQKDRSGYLHKASLLQDMSAVTAACMIVKKSVYDQVGGLTETLAVAFNDVDFCLKIREAGYLIVYDPFVCLIHDESKTRGAEDTPEKIRRFQSEIEYMEIHWTSILKNGDPYYNKNLSLAKWNYSLRPIPGMETKRGQNL